jgi:transglutaminase-like putative cysteine protease
MTTAAAARPGSLRAELTARQSALARLCAFVPLCLLGLAGWTTLLNDRPMATAWGMTLCAAAGGAAIALLTPAAPPRRRRALLAGIAAALLACAIVCAGISASLMWPRHWDELVAGIAEGLVAVPGIASPYRGDDAWVRATVLLGGTLLAAIAALQAFWPPREAHRPTSPVPAAMSLTMLWGVGVIEVPPERPFLSGAAFAILLAAFLFADRVRPAQLGPAALCVGGAALLALTLAPAFDRERPWLDLEQISEDVANTGTVAYSWDHDYRPLDWPREGRELLRIKAQSAAYWKTQALDEFDGRGWRNSGTLPSFENDGEADLGHPEWFQVIRVSVKGLRSEQFVTAGQALDISGATRRAVRVAGGTFVPERGILRRGVSYNASVYTPAPNPGELGRAGLRYPSQARFWLSVDIPDARGNPSSAPAGRRPEVTFAPFESGETDIVTMGRSLPSHDAQSALEGTGLERTYALARRLRAGSEDPYDYVKAVMARVRRDATYTERPAAAENPLDRFLFDVRRGYCQHFSGAMAVLLRMGGVPARVAVGFTPGTEDGKTGEYVVRDLDAHSWVEAYFPRYGWVTFDPTPAAAPPREQSADVALALGARRGTDGPGGDRQSDPTSAAAAADEGGSPLPLIGTAALLLAVLAALAAGAIYAVRRRAAGPSCPPELVELERALRICGRPAAAGVTLSDLERRLGGTEDARGYLRALSAQRFGTRTGGPTSAQRRALRRELASGLGRSGRLRAWLAMPPRPLGG